MERPLQGLCANASAWVIGLGAGQGGGCLQLAIAAMEKQGSGHVVQITTSLVDHANSSVPAVLAALTKGGLNAATKSLAIEYAKRGIRVRLLLAFGVLDLPHATK